MSEWKEFVLEDVIEKFIDYRGKTPKKTTSGIPLITAKIVKNGRLLEPTEFIAEEEYEAWMTRGFPEINDLILTTEAPLGEVALIKNNKVALGQRLIILQTNKKKCDSVFLKYYFQSIEGQSVLRARASGSTVEGIKSSVLKKIEIFLPTLTEQRAISDILSNLDNKIDLLFHQNSTLERMIEIIFRQWFFENSKAEWIIGTVADLANHSRRPSQPQKYPDVRFFHYSIPSFDKGKNPSEEFGSQILSNKYLVPRYCILFSKLNPHKDKRVWLLQAEVKKNSISSTEFQIIEVKDKRFLFFLYGWLTLNENYNEIASGVGGTSGSHQRIDPNTIFAYKCPLVPTDYIENYNVQIEPLFNKQAVNLTQIRTLTALRDTLLPKLLSGQVKVI